MSAPDVARTRARRLMTLDRSKQRAPYTYVSETSRRRALPAPPPARPRPQAKCCSNPNISTDEGGTICYTCGKVAQENTIVAEVTFGETAGGAAMVEGGFISDSQRHANSMGGTVRGLNTRTSRQVAYDNGKNEITALSRAVHVPDTVKDQALGWYQLAMNHSFIQGRRMRQVAAVAIYMAARRQPQNTLMLMDLAEMIQTNVWALGDTYKAFLKKLGEVDPAQLLGNKAVQEIEPLMLKYCRKLEFEDASHRVADDACKLLRCMSRDWMVEGRQPAGIAGACIIVAARMNNFRRTIREVVYVVKVADSTINARLYEFKKTPTSILNVKQFREIGPRLVSNAEPPSIWRRVEREERQEKRKLAGQNAEEEEDAQVSIEDQSGTSATEAGPSTQASKRTSKRRKSNNGAAIRSESSSADRTEPAATDAAILDGNGDAAVESAGSALAAVEAGESSDLDFVIPKKRGRAPKKREPIIITPEDLQVEEDLENDVTEAIKDWEKTFAECATNENHELLKRTRFTARQMVRAYTDVRDVPVNLSPIVAEDEFEDDPDVANCILAPEEVRRKEQIWITENEDWLREQQKKIMQEKLDAAQGKVPKPKQKRRQHQMGDGSVLEGQPAASPADAAHKMLKKHTSKNFSSFINYDKLKELFPGGTQAPTPEGSGLGTSPATSLGTNTRSPAVAQAVEAADDVEEEEEEEDVDEGEEDVQELEDEDEDDPNQYLADEDEGFGDESYDY